MSRFRCRNCKDYQKSKYTHDWRPVTYEISAKLDKRRREPQKLIFEVGLIYKCMHISQWKKKLTKRYLIATSSNFRSIWSY